VPGYLTAKSEELIKKKGAIAFGVYGIESNDRKSKLTNPVQRTKGSDRVIAKTLVAADGERYLFRTWLQRKQPHFFNLLSLS
jgi:hypothetical protein